MTWLVVAVVFIAFGGVVWLLRERASYYRRLFSSDHLEEVHTTFRSLLQTQLEAQSPIGSTPEPSGTTTTAGLILGVSLHFEEDGAVLHVSLSQQGAPTTTAAMNRIAFLLICALDGNRVSLDLFFTPSRVHHLIFTSEERSLEVKPFAEALEAYRSKYRPLPFTLRQLR